MGFFSKVKSMLDKQSVATDSDTEYLSDSAKDVVAPQVESERRRNKRVNAKPGSKILIIDDSKTICSMLKKMMEQNQYQVFTALTAEEGLTIASQEKPNLIFLDIVLPNMDGFAALRKIRKSAETQNIPVMMMSGNHQATEIFYASRIGADDFLKKPFSRYELFFRIEKMLDANLNLIRKTV